MKYIFTVLLVLVVFRLCLFYFFPVQLFDGEKINFVATLLEDPKMVGNNQKFSIRFGNFWKSATVQIITSSSQEFSYGQTLYIIGTLKKETLKNKRVYFAIQNPKIEAKNSGFLPFFGTVRAKIIDFCENNFSQPYSGLLIGIIFGIKSLLTNQITTSFRITGVGHVVAASGMNVTLVAGFLFGFLGSFLNRKLAAGVSIAGIFFYTALSGFDASIVRAALMGSLAFSAGLFGRQYSSLYILFLVGACMLLWDPLLLGDVGFQLSILATGGILLLKPSLFGSFFSDDFGTTIAAQLATLPVLLATFGQYALVSIVANVLILWTIPPITIIGAAGIGIGLVAAPIGKLIIWLVIPLVWYMVQVTSYFSHHAVSIQIEALPVLFIVGYYLILVAIILFRKFSLDSNKT